MAASKFSRHCRWVLSLDSVYGGKRSFDAHPADCGVQWGFGGLDREERELRGRGAKSNYTVASRAFAEGNSLRRTGQNVEVDLDRAAVVP